MNDYLRTKKLTTENGGVEIRVRNFRGRPSEMHRRFEQIAVQHRQRDRPANIDRNNRINNYANPNYPQRANPQSTTNSWPRAQESRDYVSDHVITIDSDRIHLHDASDENNNAKTSCPCTIL